MIESYPGDVVRSNSEHPLLKENGVCKELLVLAREGDILTVTDGEQVCKIHWHTVFVRVPRAQRAKHPTIFDR